MKQKLVLIGASTGGPGHLKKILQALPLTYRAGIVIAQHMNSTFIPSFITQFQHEIALPVEALNAQTTLLSGHIYICAHHTQLFCERSRLEATISEEGMTPYHPSIDTLFSSALNCFEGADILAVLLTGIGYDGAQGLSDLHIKGASCIAESEKSAIVYGMPKRALEINPNIDAKALEDIILSIVKFGA